MPASRPEGNQAIVDLWQQDAHSLFLRFGPTQTAVVRRDLVSTQEQRSSGRTIYTVRVMVYNYAARDAHVILQERVADRVSSVGRAFLQHRAHTMTASTVRKLGLQAVAADAEAMSELAPDMQDDGRWREAEKVQIARHKSAWLSDTDTPESALYVDVEMPTVPAGLDGAPGIALLVYQFARRSAD